MAAALAMPQRADEVVEATPIGQRVRVGDDGIATLRAAAQYKRLE
jgi:hypothetical protein